MEVHHSHQASHSKKWKAYLIEFLMLFLAVFLGFTAENIREHKVERDRGHQYIESLVNDIKTDTAQLGKIIPAYDRVMKKQDSLLKNINLLDNYFHPLTKRLTTWAISGFPEFLYTDGTIQQLKNSGGLRLVTNRKVVDSILAYDASVRETLIGQTELGKAYIEFASLHLRFFKFRIIDSMERYNNYDPNYRFQHSESEIDDYYNMLRKYRTAMTYTRLYMIREKEIATRTLAFIMKEYKLPL